jgi:DNA-binding transcriptional regulator YiaG
VKCKTHPIAVVNERTCIRGIGTLLAKITEKNGISHISPGTRHLQDKHYVIKRAYQILFDSKRPTDPESANLVIEMLKWFEKMFHTEFKSTKELKEKLEDYLKDYDERRRPLSERIKKARKKNRWTQKELANHLSYKSHVSISQFEKGQRYPSKRVMQWLEEMGM